VPRAERNILLEAAGFAAAYRRRNLAEAEMSQFREAVDWTLSRHDPYPAFAIDRHWILFAMNASANRLLGAFGVVPGASLLEALLAPGRLRQSIENWSEVAQHLGTRLKTESRHLGGDAVLDAAAARLATEHDDKSDAPAVQPAMLTTRFRAGNISLVFFSTIAQFGSAEDIALSELRIEFLFPADEMTRIALCSGAETPA
jgi:hypothetical protein